MARKKIPLTKRQIKLLEQLAGQGLNIPQMAAILGLSQRTLERRLKDTPDAIGGLEKGRAAAARKVTETAYKLAVSGKAPAMTMFWLKCRERWTERHVLEHVGKDGGPIETRDVTTLPDEQLEARIEALLAKVPGGAKPEVSPEVSPELSNEPK